MQNILVISRSLYFIPRIFLLYEKKHRVTSTACQPSEKRRWVWLTVHSNSIATKSIMASSKILVAFLPVVFSLLLQASQYLVEAFIRYQRRCRNSLFFLCFLKEVKCNSLNILSKCSLALCLVLCWKLCMSLDKHPLSNDGKFQHKCMNIFCAMNC